MQGRAHIGLGVVAKEARFWYNQKLKEYAAAFARKKQS